MSIFYKVQEPEEIKYTPYQVIEPIDDPQYLLNTVVPERDWKRTEVMKSTLSKTMHLFDEETSLKAGSYYEVVR